MLKNMKLGTKITAGFALMIIMAVSLGTLAIVKMAGVTTGATQLAQESVPMVKGANEVERQSLLTMYEMRAYGLSEEATYLKNGNERLKQVDDALKVCQDLAAKEGISELAAAATKAQQAVDEYKKLIAQTTDMIGQMDKFRAGMDESAGAYMKECYTYLDSQNEKLKEEVTANAGAEAISDRHMKITLGNDIIDLGNECRITNFKAQALREPELIDKVLPKFDSIDAKVEQLRKATKQQANLDQLARCQEAGQTYKKNMLGLVQTWRQLNDLAKVRAQVAERVLEEAKSTTVRGIDETDQVAQDAVSSLNAATQVMVVGLTVVLVLGVVMAIVITRSIVKP
ncbi:MAG: hypothetical protein IT443_13045, partial [Phycisphaeraceae bacterium]|nr:hypothetical protein [Phycisphaeraceae bacterium]